MRYKIVYDKPGRLRLRMRQGAFEAAQGYGIEQLLTSRTGVISAEATSVNGGILIYYTPGSRDDVLAVIGKLDRNNLPESRKQDDNWTRELDDVFFRSLAVTVGRHYTIKWFLPAPLRIACTLRRIFFHLRRGMHSLQKGKLNIDVLDATAVTAAAIQRDFGTASSIMMLLRVSELLEDYTRKKTRQMLTRSLALNIDNVWTVREQQDILTPVSQVCVGDLLRVRAGSVIPLDGEVVEGEAIVNEASMTGEPLGVLRSPRHSVYAGTVIEEGALVVKVRTLADNTRIQNIVSLIDNSEMLKAEVQSKAEKLADSIVPFSFLTSLATLLLTRNVTKALSVLMVDYSCAIKLSAPICVISAMHEAAKRRILVKGGKYLEAFANADTIVFDKTGTLTQACPRVAKVVPCGGRSRNEVLKIAACLEEHFPHSVAKAIVKQAEAENLFHKEEHAEVEYVVAHGISSMLYGERILIGSAHFIFDDNGIEMPDAEKDTIENETEGYSAVYLAIGGKLAGMICVEDPVHTEALGTLNSLRELGIEHIIMLTGDGEAAARAACKALNITEYYAQVLPEDKARVIRSLKELGRTVIMVGDGINDSPALSCADVSVAMKDGSDIAKEVADITLSSENLDGLITLRHLSKALFKRIGRNYLSILGVNTTLLLLGVGGVIQPSASAFLHNTSTMLLSGMSMRPYLRESDERQSENELTFSRPSTDAAPEINDPQRRTICSPRSRQRKKQDYCGQRGGAFLFIYNRLRTKRQTRGSLSGFAAAAKAPEQGSPSTSVI